MAAVFGILERKLLSSPYCLHKFLLECARAHTTSTNQSKRSFPFLANQKEKRSQSSFVSRFFPPMAPVKNLVSSNNTRQKQSFQFCFLVQSVKSGSSTALRIPSQYFPVHGITLKTALGRGVRPTVPLLTTTRS